MFPRGTKSKPSWDFRSGLCLLEGLNWLIIWSTAYLLPRKRPFSRRTFSTTSLKVRPFNYYLGKIRVWYHEQKCKFSRWQTSYYVDQFKKLESLYCKLHRGKLFMWHHLVAKCKNEKPSKLHQKQFWIPNKVLNSTSHKSMKNKLIVFSITDHYAPQSYQFCMNIKQGFKSCQKFIMRMKKKCQTKIRFHCGVSNCIVATQRIKNPIISLSIKLHFSKVWVAKVRARTHTCDVRSHVCVCVRNPFWKVCGMCVRAARFWACKTCTC